MIYWPIYFLREPDIGIGGRTVDNYYLNNGQWLIKQSNNFSQIRGFQNALVCINQKNCQPITKDGAHLLFIWGKQPTVVNVANRKFEIFTDKQAESIDKQKLMLDLAPNIQYLDSIFERQLGKRINRSIRIIMLANNSSKVKEGGGSALDHAFLVNYYVRGGRLTKNWLKITSHIILHEYIHHLASCDSFPRWACESLADYYTYKSLALGQPTLKALHEWNEVKQYDTNHQLGLYRVNELYEQTKNQQYYGSFYAKGAAFWNELDLMLQQHNSNLDHLISLIVINPMDNKIRLPKRFTDKVISIIGKDKFDRLTTYYLN